MQHLFLQARLAHRRVTRYLLPFLLLSACGCLSLPPTDHAQGVPTASTVDSAAAPQDRVWQTPAAVSPSAERDESPSPLAPIATFLTGRDSNLAKQWDAWGRRHLRDGDVIFTMGQSRVVMGLINFSKFSSDIADSRFSHVGIVAIENGEPFVYDTVSGGPRRKPFGWYLARNKVQRVAIKRPRPQLAEHASAAAEFCRGVHRAQVPFDEQFRLNDDRYYCAELVDLAYRQRGVPLCVPIAIEELPNYDRFPASVAWAVETFTSISSEQAILLPGNERHGIWSSPDLMLLLSERAPRQGPPVQ